jgi:hypothetical protein
MKGCRWFFGILFLVLIAVSQSVAADNIIPPSLENAIESVKKMKRAGASNKDIADFVTKTVANRLTFLNHTSKQIDSIMGDAELEKKLKHFDAFDNAGNMRYDVHASAIWAWENRMGQCNEGANTAFHILAMAYESTNEILPLNMPNHRFIILGNHVNNIPNPFSPDDLRNLDDTYIIDPWDGRSFSTKDLSIFDHSQHGQGNPVGEGSYKAYKHRYEKWLTWCKENPVKYQKWLHGLSDTAAEEKIENKDSMDSTLARHRKEIDELNAIKKQILENGKANLDKIRSNLRDANIIRFEQGKYETLILAFVDQGEKSCDQASKRHQKMIALSAAMADGEELVNARINPAKNRTATCKTDEDDVFIKTNYQAAQDAFAIMKTAKEAAFELFVDITVELQQIQKINEELNLHSSDMWKEKKSQYDGLIKEIPPYLDKLETGLKEAKGFPVKVKDLKKKIEDSKKYYIQYFPRATSEFDILISEINSIRLQYVTSVAGLDDLYQEYRSAQTALDTPMGNNSRLFNGAPPLINCLSHETSEKVMEKINEAFFRGLFVLKSNDDLRDGCQVKVAVQKPHQGSDQSPPDSPPKPPATGEVKTDTDTGPEECTDGLIITGPTQIEFDQGISYMARDKAGKPYPPGSISWSYSDESIVSLYTSGNPVTGVGFKAGTFVIMAHCGSYTAYLDVEIKDKENNLFSVSGAEEIKNEESPFSVSSVEEVKTENETDCSYIPGSTAVQGKCICTGGLILSPSRGRCLSCDEYYQAVESAFNGKKFGAAQAMVNEARECSWAAKVQGLINNVKLNQVCENISAKLQAACRANNAKAVHGFMGEANQNKCNIDPGLWQWGNAVVSAYNQEIKAQAAVQNSPQQPKNQTNWMDAVNIFAQGVKDVQQNSAPKPHPLPKNNLPSFPTRTYTGMNSGIISNVPGAGSVSSSTNTGQSQNNSNHSGSLCKGHSIKCGSMWKAWPSILDSNNDKVCDECGRPYKPSWKVYKSWQEACEGKKVTEVK